MFEKIFNSIKFPYLPPFFIFQNLSLPSFLLQLCKLCLITTIYGLLFTMRAKTFIKHAKFDETNSKLEKKVTSFRPKKHQDENASETPDFLCTLFQMSSKHLEPLIAIRNQYMFLQMVEKRTPTAPLESRDKLYKKSRFFPKVEIRWFLVKFKNYHVGRNKPSIRTMTRTSLSWNPDDSKVWKKIHI